MLRNTWIIGAAADCQLVFDVPTVSSRHCRLTRSGKGLVLEDLGSTNGTFVNDQQVWDAAPVSRGDRIGLGREIVLEVDFLLDQMTAPAPASRSLWSLRHVGRKPVLAASVLLTLALLSVAVAQFSGSTAEDASAIAANTTGSKEQGTLQNSPAVADETSVQTANIASGSSETQPLDSPAGPVNETHSAAPPPSASPKSVAVDPRQVDDPRQAVYAVVVHPVQNGNAVQIGTAWAATPQRLVTSGSVVEFLKRDRAKFPRVTVKCDALGKVLSVTSFKVHPEYARLEPEFQQTLKVFRDHGDQLDVAEEAGRTPSVTLENEFAAAFAKLKQASEERTFFDLGLLEVEERLPVCLPIARTNSEDHLKTPVSVLGGAPPHGTVDPSQLILPPRRLPCLRGSKRTWDRDDGSFIRWQWQTEASLLGRDWTGSPLLDATGRVIGLVSRSTPPASLHGESAADQLDAVSIQQLDRLLP